MKDIIVNNKKKVQIKIKIKTIKEKEY